MEKIIKRKTTFEGKKEDYSLSFDYRILGVEKRLLDFISDYCLEDIAQDFVILQGEEEKLTFTKKDFDSENVDITLKQASSICKKLQVEEEIIKTLKNEKQDSENVVIHRVVRLTY